MRTRSSSSIEGKPSMVAGQYDGKCNFAMLTFRSWTIGRSCLLYSRWRLRQQRAFPLFSLFSFYPPSSSCLAIMSSSGAALSDGRVQNRIENYNQFWQKDLNKEDEQGNKNRLEQYTEVVNGTSSRLAYSSRRQHYNSPFFRLLRRCNRLVRVWLGTVVPLLALLQGRVLRGLARPARALPRRADAAPAWHARARRRLRCWRARTRDRAVRGREHCRPEQQRLPDHPCEEAHEVRQPREPGLLRQG